MPGSPTMSHGVNMFPSSRDLFVPTFAAMGVDGSPATATSFHFFTSPSLCLHSYMGTFLAKHVPQTCKKLDLDPFLHFSFLLLNL